MPQIPIPGKFRVRLTEHVNCSEAYLAAAAAAITELSSKPLDNDCL